ncbi:hypothetical protein H4219_005505 [Mycoemilia scoparia]|uniref:Importin N-terminal domain-containing protein n=1 Tax=Mycoemilia scoparia TaxID=417184 RepID=A0A9W7ZTE1_9FUNG|nr:hypothetical protein H4219_005505 [Mycoemilia scoparia]
MESTVYATLANALSSDPNVRMPAEQELKQFENQHEEYPAALSSIAIADQCEFAARQLSLVLLKTYISKHWNMAVESYEEGNLVPSPQIKSRIREQIFSLLTTTTSTSTDIGNDQTKILKKLKSAAAYVISNMARYDWPDEWPTLFDQLLHLLRQENNIDQVQSAIRVFNEWIQRNMTEDHAPQLYNLLGELKRIVANQNGQYPANIRATAINVYTECLEILCTAFPESQPGVAGSTETTTSITPDQSAFVVTEWSAIIFDILRQPITLGPNSNIGIKVEAARAVTIYLQGFGDLVKPLCKELLEITWNELQWILPRYEAEYIHDQDIPEEESLIYTNLDGDQVGVDHYVYGLFDNISRLSRKKHLRNIFVIQKEEIDGTTNGKKKVVPVEPTAFTIEFVSLLISFCQITTDMGEEWENDIDLYIADEDEEGFSFNVRVAAQEALVGLEMGLGKIAIQTIISACFKCFEKCKHIHQNGSGDINSWWKLAEAGLLVLGTLANDIIEMAKTNPEKAQQLNMPWLLDNILMPLSQQNLLPFGQGRVFIFSSQFSKAIPSNIGVSILQAASNIGGTNNSGSNSEGGHPVVWVSALRACGNFCRYMDPELVKPYIPSIVENSAKLLMQLSEDSLHISLDAFYLAIKVDTDTTAQMEPIIGPLILDIWKKYPADAWITGMIADIFGVLASNPKCNEAFHQRALPAIGEAIVGGEENAGACESAIDLLASLIGGLPSPLPQGYVQTVFPPLIKVLLGAEDHAILQNGEICLKKLIIKDVNQIAEWRDEQNVTGLDYILRFITMLLQPHGSESVALFVGDLVCKLVQRGSQYITGNVMITLIDIMTARLETARTSSFISSLLPFYAHLIANHPADVVNALENWTPREPANQGTDQATGQPRTGLDILMPAWCDNHKDIRGYYYTKTAAIALCKLFELDNPKLDSILVNGDLVPHPATKGRIVTRSLAKRAPDQYTRIPARVKIVKLIFGEISTNIEALYSKGGSAVGDMPGSNGGGNESDGWEDFDDEYGGGDCEDLDDELALLSDMIDGTGNFRSMMLGESEGEDSEEEYEQTVLKDDPIYNTDINQYLREFVRHSVNSNAKGFTDPRFLAHFTSQEKEIVQKIMDNQ